MIGRGNVRERRQATPNAPVKNDSLISSTRRSPARKSAKMLVTVPSSTKAATGSSSRRRSRIHSDSLSRVPHTEARPRYKDYQMPLRTHGPIDHRPNAASVPAVSTESGSRRTRAMSASSQPVSALAVGAIAIGALAIGVMVIGRLTIGRARIRRLEIDELVVRKLRVTDVLQTPTGHGTGT
jgi:hypothetical protein